MRDVIAFAQQAKQVIVTSSHDMMLGGPPGARTPHQKLKRLLLYQMS